MSKLVWDTISERLYETGINRGVLYPYNNAKKEYGEGVAWNGLIGVNENPTGAEPTPLYANNIKYLNLMSAEEFGATIEAFTYPDEFAECNGENELTTGVAIGQQTRTPFGLVYRTKIGSDVDSDLGYKIHFVYGALAAPSDKTYATINDSPEAVTFSWTLTTTPVEVSGFKPTATLVVDSTKIDKEKLNLLEDALYGTEEDQPRLLLPDEVLTLIGEQGPQG